MHIQTADFIHVVQGRVGNRDAADKHRFQPCHRGNSAGAAHLEFHIFNDRQLFLGRELVGNRPARCPGDKPELLLEIQAVHLEHDAVDFIGQAVTLFHQLVVGLQAGFRTLGLAHFRVDPETPVAHQLKAVPVGARQHAFVRYCHAVGAELQRAFGGDGRFLLAQTAGGGITRVNKGLLVLLCQPLVQFLEPGFGHVHLATHLYQLRIAAAPKLQRYRRNRSDVGGDVFAGIAIAPGGSAGQQSVLVMQADRQAIELGFADVLNGVFGVQAVADPAVEVPQFVFTEGVVQ